MKSVIYMPLARRIDCGLKNPSGSPVVIIERVIIRYRVEDKITLEQAQLLVGGYVEVVCVVPTAPDVLILADEEGLLKGLFPSMLRGIVGPVVILGTRNTEEGGEWIGLTPEQDAAQLALLGLAGYDVRDGGLLPVGRN